MGNMNFVMFVAGMLVSAVAQQECEQHAATAGGAPLKGFGTCSEEEQALNLMRFPRDMASPPHGWGTVPLCGGTWEGVTCTNGCVTGVSFAYSGGGTLDFSTLPSGLQDLVLSGNKFSGTPNLSTLPSGLQ
eukprot:Hpha_TRINITY_DN16892_c0_g1::TRINITY_DN16892_c0_g1_i19::g.150066::m.150066